MHRHSTCAALVALAFGVHTPFAAAQTVPGANIGGGRIVIPNTNPILRGAAGTNLRGPFPGYRTPSAVGPQGFNPRTPTLIESVGITTVTVPLYLGGDLGQTMSQQYISAVTTNAALAQSAGLGGLGQQGGQIGQLGQIGQIQGGQLGQLGQLGQGGGQIGILGGQGGGAFGGGGKFGGGGGILGGGGAFGSRHYGI